jgi:hypothetical protein
MPSGYTIRESRKAKHVSLKLSVAGSLEVIVPSGFDRECIPAIVQKKQSWIERTRQRMQMQQSALGLQSVDTLPEQIALRAIAEDWQIDYCPTPRLGIKAVGHSNLCLTVSGAVGDRTNSQTRTLCRAVLQQWVAHKASFHLLPWLRQVSRELSLPFESARIRRQKTLWGSCSARKTISLNSKLLFIPPELVRYVLIHELCHTVHLNHSTDFWALVASYESNYQQLDAQLRDSRFCVPPWMEL